MIEINGVKIYEKSEYRGIQDEEAKKKILAALSDISDQYYKIDALKEQIKETVTAIADEHEIPKKIVNKMARAYYKNSFDQERQESSDYEAYYESIVRSNQK